VINDNDSKDWLDVCNELVKIVLPVAILSAGLFGLFTDKLSNEDSYMLITSGCLGAGLNGNIKR
jgi:hypothetical protein